MKDNNPSVSLDLFATPSDLTGHTGNILKQLFDTVQRVEAKIDAMPSCACTDNTSRIKRCVRERIADLKCSGRRDWQKRVCMVFVAAVVFSRECTNSHVYFYEYNLQEFNEVFDVKVGKSTFSRYVSPLYKDDKKYSSNDLEIRQHIKIFKRILSLS